MMNDYISQFRSKMTYYWLSAHFGDLGKFSAQVVSVARREGDPIVQAAATLGVARHLRATGSFRMARAAADSSFTQSEVLGNALLMADALTERARITLEGYFDPLEARSDLSQALTLAVGVKYVEGEALACVGLARAWLLADRPAVALEWASRAERLAREHLDSLALAEASLVRGLTLMTLGRRREADSVLDDALSLCKRLDYNVYRPLVAIAIVLNQPYYSDAHVRILTAYATSPEWQDHFAVRWAASEGLIQVANHSLEKDESLTLALAAADRLRALAVEVQHPPLALAYARWMGYLALTYSHDYDEAAAHMVDLIELARQYANPFQAMHGWMRLGLIYRDMGNSTRAHEAFRSARTVALSIGDAEQARVLLLLQLVSGALGLLQRVLSWFGLGQG